MKWNPSRTCLGCRKTRNKEDLIRVVRTPDGGTLIDHDQKMSGRGAYLCRDEDCLKRVRKSGALGRSLKIGIPAELFSDLLEEVARDS